MSKSNNFTEKFFALPKYSFLLTHGGVRRIEDAAGNWVNRWSVHEVVECMQEEINRLQKDLTQAVWLLQRPKTLKSLESLTEYNDEFAEFLERHNE